MKAVAVHRVTCTLSARRLSQLALVLALLWLAPFAKGAERGPLPNIDKRRHRAEAELLASPERQKGLAHLRELAPGANVDFDPVTGGPKWVSADAGAAHPNAAGQGADAAAQRPYLSGPNGLGKGIPLNAHRGLNQADRHRAVKAFLNEHAALFGHDAIALNGARIIREYTSAHNGLHTTVWQQEFDGIPVFESVLIGHITRAGELVNVSSQFVPAGTKPGLSPKGEREKTARRAVFLAAQNIEEVLTEDDVQPNPSPQGGRPGSQHFTADQLKGDVDAQLAWLPIDSKTLRLCWDVILMSRTRHEMYRVLVDAESGQILVRYSLNCDISNASYRVYPSDSPSPWSPGPLSPTGAQPTNVARVLVVTNAFNTNASPNGWINDGDNETKGNNVDAHLDRDGNDQPDLPRPQGSPSRVFDFPLDLSQDPSTYGNAAVVNAFYWCNWYHDKLYELGFTEAAGNFQFNNFGRGGYDHDPLLAQVQDAADVRNERFFPQPDGVSPRVEFYIFNDPNPMRDGALDTEGILHEITHGLSNRRVGGGILITLSQSLGLGEGWSDFYALSFLSQANDAVDGNYAFGGYLGYQFYGLTNNYYFGLRRYPYSIDMSRNPLTFKDIDPSQASPHSGIPRSPLTFLAGPDEPHNQGQLWGVALWEARANLINRYGFVTGNQLILQIVSDGMALTPPNPTYIQARDCVIQADVINNNGANYLDLWAAFARRGLGVSATAPGSRTTREVHESFDLPDDLLLSPQTDVLAIGPAGGPFAPSNQVYKLTNVGSSTISWNIRKVPDVNWLLIPNGSGTLAPGAPAASINVVLNNNAYAMSDGVYTTSLILSNQVSGRTQSRRMILRVGDFDNFTESFDNADNDLSFRSFTFYPDGSRSFYSVCQEPATAFPTDPRPAKTLTLADDASQSVTLSGNARVSLYGQSTNLFFIGSNGYLTFGDGDTNLSPSLSEHFRLRRIAALFLDLNPANGGRVSWEQLADRVAVTFENISEWVDPSTPRNSNNFQYELFFDGRIRLTFLKVDAHGGIVGLSSGSDLPLGFLESDFSAYGSCSARLALTLPAVATEGAGTLVNQGQVSVPTPNSTNLTVILQSSNPAEVVVPSSVLIPAGQTSAVFDVTIVDDAILDGTQVATVNASATRYLSASQAVSVRDNEFAALSLSFPTSVSETSGVIPAMVSVNGTVSRDVDVALASSDSSRVNVPAIVVLPAGSSAVSFPLTIIDNNLIEGGASVRITAQVDNWTSAIRSISVADNEAPELTLRLPLAFSEASGVLSGAGIVSTRGAVASNVVVSVSSLDEDKVSVPSAVLLPAGQSNVTFDLTAVNDFVPDGDRDVAIFVSAPGFGSASNIVKVLDDETPSAPSLPTPANLATGQPVEMDLRWTFAEGELIQNGDFEAGSFVGWQHQTIGGGDFVLNDGTVNPTGPDGPLPPLAGRWGALSLQSTAGQRTLYQDITIPPASPQVTLRWWDRIRNHGASFSTNQQFRVEVRDINDNVVAIAFLTRPGDPLQSDWTERSFDLTPFRGETIRLAFVQTDSSYFNVHIDNVSVVAIPPESVSFSVYMGTSPDLQSGQFLGSTTNRFWHVSGLLPQTTYFWRIVAIRGGQTSGPLWQFSTVGVDHFDISHSADVQTAGVPFPVTITAKSAAGAVVSNFNGVIHLGTIYGPGPITILREDFEGPTLIGWTTNNANFAFSGSAAAQGMRSLLLSGGSGLPTAGVSRPLPNLRPGRVTFAARAPSNMTAGGALMMAAGPTNAVAIFEFGPDGTMGIKDGSGGTYTVPYESNRWYHLTFDLNWDNRSVDFYVDDNAVELGVPFRGNATFISGIYLYNQNNTSSMWDDIQFLKLSGLQPLYVTPIAISNYVNGAWSGDVTLHEAQLGVRLEARDESGHSGVGDIFDSVVGDDLSLEVVTSANPVPADTEAMRYTIRIFNSGPSAATGISLSNSFSRPVQVNFAQTSGGSCVNTATNVVCDLPALAGDSTATVLIEIVTPSAGPLTNIASITRNGPDGDTDNNSFRTSTDIIPAITVSIDDTNLVEGDIGMTNASFQLRLSGATTFPVTVFYNTSAGSAVAGADFVARSGSVVFMPGVTRRAIDIPVQNDLLRESNETFFVNLFASENAGIADILGAGLIIDNDPPVNLSIEDAMLTEPDSGTLPMLFRVSLSQVSGVPVQVNFSTSNGTAIAGTDYIATSGTIAIPPGETNGWISVAITADAPGETNETFFVTLSNATNAVLTRSQAVGNILDRAAPPCVSIDDVTVVEGDAGQSTALFTVSLSRLPQTPVSVVAKTSNGTASAGEDYVSAENLLVLTSGVVSVTFSVPIIGDLRNESTESFFVTLTNATNAWICKSQGTGRILDNDPMPTLSMVGGTIREGNLGSTNALVHVNLSAPSGRTVSVDFATDDGSALAGTDYTGASGTITFPPGVTDQSISVNIPNDRSIEPSKTFFVHLLRPVNALLQTASAAVNILDDDGAAGLLNHFDWNTVPSPQSANSPFGVSLSARDVFGNVVSDFSGTVQISARVAGMDLVAGQGTRAFVPPLNAFFQNGRTESLYLTNELGAARQLTGLALDVISPSGQALKNWTIRLKHSASSTLSAAWDASGWTTVYSSNINVVSNGWTWFPFTSPFAYNGTNHLLVDFSFNNGSFSYDGQCHSTATAQPRTLALGTDTGGDPRSWGGASPLGVLYSEIPNIRFSTLSLPWPLQPTNAGPFNNGAWSGNVQVQAPATNIFLWADDQTGHFGGGNLFNVRMENPTITASIFRVGNSVQIIWTSQSGSNYRVAYKTFLNQSNWVALPDDVHATGSSASRLDPIDFTTQRFYRVFLVP